jgi:3alpha(or 20beta)-hydroxysteroid dehydrogenase
MMLEGRVAIITGGARGQGAAEGRLFAAEGARVVLTDVLDDEGTEVARSLPNDATFVHHDVASEADWANVVGLTLHRYGQIDVLINNAGVGFTAPLIETSLDDFKRLVNVNQVGTFLGIRAVTPPMIKTGSGTIINVSSTSGLRGMKNGLAYSATKWAVRGMTRCAALELAPFGIKVNSIHPGVTDTAFLGGMSDGVRRMLTGEIPVGRFGQPEDVARMALFLASDLCSFSTGSEFVVDGGTTAGSLGLERPACD